MDNNGKITLPTLVTRRLWRDCNGKLHTTWRIAVRETLVARLVSIVGEAPLDPTKEELAEVLLRNAAAVIKLLSTATRIKL